MVTIIIDDIKQGDAEWFAAKCGVPSASKADHIVTGKGEWSKSADKYILQLAGERLAGKKEVSYSNAIMQRGVELESEARGMYEVTHGVEVQQVALCYKDESRSFISSPDGLIGETRGLEIKCPKSPKFTMSNHVYYMLNPKMLVADYFQQVQSGLYVTGRELWDVMSYYPGLPPLVVEVERDEVFIAALEKMLRRFNAKLEDTTEKLMKYL